MELTESVFFLGISTLKIIFTAVDFFLDKCLKLNGE